jgi:hypothetical protein
MFFIVRVRGGGGIYVSKTEWKAMEWQEMTIPYRTK